MKRDDIKEKVVKLFEDLGAENWEKAAGKLGTIAADDPLVQALNDPEVIRAATRSASDLLQKISDELKKQADPEQAPRAMVRKISRKKQGKGGK